MGGLNNPKEDPIVGCSGGPWQGLFPATENLLFKIEAEFKKSSNLRKTNLTFLEKNNN